MWEGSPFQSHLAPLPAPTSGTDALLATVAIISSTITTNTHLQCFVPSPSPSLPPIAMLLLLHR